MSSKVRLSSATALKRVSERSESTEVITEVPKERFSWEHNAGPYEMSSQEALHRMPYQRPSSAQELEGTKVHPQEMDGGPADKTGE